MDNFLDTLLHLQPALQLVAERILRSATEAEDTVQEVVVELWQKREHLQQVLSLEAYAMQTVKNRCISLLRKQQNIVLADIERFENISDEETIAEAALLEERAAQLDRMMEQLPERQRLAVKMKYIDGLSHEEMQRQMGMSSTHVYATLSRALGTLKQMVRR